MALPPAVVRYRENRSVRYVVPFAVFLVFLFVFERLPISPAVKSSVWVLCLAPVCAFCWPRWISLKPVRSFWSVAIGAAVFLIWIAPDLLFHGYRDLPLFSNSIVGHMQSPTPAASLHSVWFLSWRTVRAVVIVPVVEELFWRAWLMRWLIDTNFERVPLGTFAPLSFWLTALLFASEHGPYWDVGLATGIIYNSWMVRSKSVADCILMHAVTNGLLCAYIIGAGQWQYWM